MRFKRLLALLIDICVLTIISQLLIIFSFIDENVILFLAISIIITLILCKDISNGQSLGKRFMSIQIINEKTFLAASAVRSIIRNLFLIFWPIEIFFWLVMKDKRLGDIVTKTKLVSQPNRFPIKLNKNSLIHVLVCFLIVSIFTKLGLILLKMNFPMVKLLFTE